MISIDFSELQLKRLATHHVGNKQHDEDVVLSEEESFVENKTEEHLLKYFLQPFKTEEFFHFTNPVELALNGVYSVVQRIFDNQKNFVTESQHLANLLYEVSVHPKVKKGELNVAYFKQVAYGTEWVDAIGIFKSENDVPFIKMKSEDASFSIRHDYGFELKGIDKGCIIFNVSKEEGYKILIYDALHSAAEAKYWKDDFLAVEQVNDEFQQTNQFLGITKKFVTKQLTEDFVVSKADQIDLLNRSVEYFKTHETFDKTDFEKEVFQDPNIINSFRSFDENYREVHEVELLDVFEISQQAVKKQARVFKSVLKLDKNFHIYIHGDRNKIEQGVDGDGRKYYKIYYEQEA